VDVPYQFLYYFFEDDDERVERLACEYRDGTLLSGELKRIAAEEVAAFLKSHRERKAALDSLESELAQYRLRADGRASARRRVGYPDDALAQL
jgi:tryptophanyl-tRNA synthetase